MKKTCPHCKQEKNFSDFTKDKTKTHGYYPLCKICKREVARLRYSTADVGNRRIKDKLRAQQRSTLIATKKSVGCQICKESESVCLDLHHLNPNEKDFGIAHYRNASIDKITDEMKKCIVLCANCHRKVHASLITLL